MNIIRTKKSILFLLLTVAFSSYITAASTGTALRTANRIAAYLPVSMPLGFATFWTVAIHACVMAEETDTFRQGRLRTEEAVREEKRKQTTLQKEIDARCQFSD